MRSVMSLPASEYIESRNGGFYIPGTRIGLGVLVYDFRRGETPEAILQAYPSTGCLAKVYGAITLILENPEGIEEYLRDQERLWQKFREEHPIPEHMLEPFRNAQKTRT